MPTLTRRRISSILNRRGVPPTILFLGAVALYAGTMIRTPGWLDDTLLLSQAWTGEVNSWAYNHSLFNLLGHGWLALWSFVDPHTALTLLCGIFASVSVLFAYHAGRELTGNRLAGALAAAGLAVSHSLWWHATVVEVYSLNAAFITLDLFLLTRYFRARSFASLAAAYFLFGVGVFNHVLMGLFVAAYGTLFVILLAGRERIGWRKGLVLVGATLLGCVPYAVVFARDTATLAPAQGLLRAVWSTLDSATGSAYRQSMFPRNLSAGDQAFWKANYLFLLWYNFPAAALPLAAWGTVRLRRREYPLPLSVFFWLALAAQLIWSSNYLIWDMYAFSMPVYVLASFPLAVGVDALLHHDRPVLKVVVLGSLMTPALLYPLLTSVPALAELGRKYIALYKASSSGLETEYAELQARPLGLKEATGGVWDPVRYLMNPARAGYREEEEFCAGLLASLPPGAHYWDDDSKGGYPLHYYYQGMLHRRQDLTLHLLMAVDVDESSARSEAQIMRDIASAGGPVLVSTLAWPERELLIQLSLLLGSHVDPRTLRALRDEEVMNHMPHLSITPLALGTRPGLVVYRVRLR